MQALAGSRVAIPEVQEDRLRGNGSEKRTVNAGARRFCSWDRAMRWSSSANRSRRRPSSQRRSRAGTRPGRMDGSPRSSATTDLRGSTFWNGGSTIAIGSSRTSNPRTGTGRGTATPKKRVRVLDRPYGRAEERENITRFSFSNRSAIRSRRPRSSCSTPGCLTPSPLRTVISRSFRLSGNQNRRLLRLRRVGGGAGVRRAGATAYLSRD